MNTQRFKILTAAALIGGATWGQQLPQLSQYVSHDYLYNPAVAGSRPWFEMRSAHRNQWVGIQDAPRTFMLSATTPLGTNMGVGGFLYTDHVGPTRRTGAQASYAYHLRLTDGIRLGMGLSLGLQQFLIDGSKITFHDNYDPIMDDQLRGSTLPDASFSLYAYGERWWAGATAPQLLEGRIWFYDDADQSLSTLERHYYLMGGYRIQLGEDFRVEPSVLVKYVEPVPAKVDITATLRYKEQLWLGATYRTNDAISVMLGYWLKKTFQFGYSYDITTTNLNRYSNGTHEVMLAITLGKKPPEKREETTPVPAAPPVTP
jgi:type IX secretion system PorP/SprF family membrane protein